MRRIKTYFTKYGKVCSLDPQYTWVIYKVILRRSATFEGRTKKNGAKVLRFSLMKVRTLGAFS